MINSLVAKVFGTKNEREIKHLLPQVEAINAFEPAMQKLSDDELRAKTDEFRKKIQEHLSRITDDAEADADRQKLIETERDQALKDVLEELLPEAFAVVREAGRRVLNMRHFDVQLIGGMKLRPSMGGWVRDAHSKASTLPA